MPHGHLLLRVLSVGSVMQVTHSLYNLLMQERESSTKKGSTINVANNDCQEFCLSEAVQKTLPLHVGPVIISGSL